VGDGGKAVFMAVSVMVGVFVAIALAVQFFFFVVMTVKSSTSSISSRVGESVAGTGLSGPGLGAMVPPWEQCTSADTVMVVVGVPEGHVTGERDLVLVGLDSLVWSSVGRGVLSAHIVVSDSEFSDEEISDSALSLDRRVCLGSLVKMVDFPITLSLVDLVLIVLCGFLEVAFTAEGPPTSITLLTPCGSNLVILDFAILAAAGYSPNPSIPGMR
jgi:hypothetical protein